MQIVSIGDNLHEMSKPVSRQKDRIDFADVQAMRNLYHSLG